MGGPGPGIAARSVPSKVARAYIKRSLTLLRPSWHLAAASILLGLIATALPFAVPLAFGPIVQMITQAGGNLEKVWGGELALWTHPDHTHGGPTLAFAGWLIVWAGALVLSPILSLVRAWVDSQVAWKLMTEIRQRVHDHLQSLSLDFFTGARSGTLMQRVQLEATGVQTLLTDCLIPPVIDAVVLIGAVIWVLTVSWQMTLATLILSPFALMALEIVGKRLRATMQRQMQNNRQLGGELEETITGISDIQIFNAQNRRSERFQSASSKAAKGTAMIQVWFQMGSRSTQIFVALSQALVLIVGVSFSKSFGLSVSSLIQFVGLVPTMFQPAQRIVDAYTKYNSTVPNVAATYELLDTKPTIEERPDAIHLGEVHGNIVFEDVVFGYSSHQKTLEGLSFSISEGETIALVGPIGAGKSTILNLMLRFLEPESGRILLDGYDISEVTLNSLREQVSKLSQFPFFLTDSIRENVRLGQQGASDADVEAACAHAHVHGVIVDPLKIERGYDTVVDVQVPSGGQKRLIALARCLLRKPEVLLLDEPTENLDADQRVRIMRVIREYASERTCIVISHDMDFIAGVADRIIVLNGGQVAQQGTHEELLARGGLYRALYEAQNEASAVVVETTPGVDVAAPPTIGATPMRPPSYH